MTTSRRLSRRKPVAMLVVFAALAALVVAITLWGLQPASPRHSTPCGTQVDKESAQNPPHAHQVPAVAGEPAYEAPRTTARELTALVDRDAGRRVTPDIATRIPFVRHEEDVPAVVSVLLDAEDDDTARHEAAALLRRSGYPGLTEASGRLPVTTTRFREFGP